MAPEVSCGRWWGGGQRVGRGSRGRGNSPLRSRRYVKNAEVEGKFFEEKRSDLEGKKRALVRPLETHAGNGKTGPGAQADRRGLLGRGVWSQQPLEHV